ncbi:hypothetical protein [Pleomorphomonas sp. PLEO]|uniref:hypothetical protein n=1 Tax=Pleomorphomonas sp. PLEO TaxID=3239306 RepID=UPI00351F0036
MAKDPREGLTPTVVRASLLHLVKQHKDLTRHTPDECWLHIKPEDAVRLAAAERWLEEMELQNIELKQEIYGLRKRNENLIEDIKKYERGQK